MTTPDPTPVADYVNALGALAEPPKAGKAEINATRRYTYTYLTLPDLISAVRPVLATHRLAFTQDVAIGQGQVIVTTHIVHTSGTTWSSLPFALPCGRTPQEIGSALTYARRYCLATFVGLAGADDDDAATARHHTPAAGEQLPPVDPETGEILEPPASRRRDRNTTNPPRTRKVSDKQLVMIHTMLKDQGITDREQALQLLASLARIDGTLASSKDLTGVQASMVIDELRTLTTPPEPQEGP